MKKFFALRFSRQLLLAVLLPLAVSTFSAAAETASPAELRLQAIEAASRGKLENAATLWQQLSADRAAAGDTAGELDAQLQLADVYQRFGLPRQAFNALRRAQALLDGNADSLGVAQQVALANSLGRLYLQSGDLQQAEQQLFAAASLARDNQLALAQAAALNDLGTLYGSRGDYSNAGNVLREAAALAQIGTGDATLAARATANAGRAALLAQDNASASALLNDALALAQALPDSHDKTQTLAAIGRISQQQLRQQPSPATLQRAHTALRRSADLAQQLDDARAASYALGYLSELYTDRGQFNDALSLSRQAVFAAQQADAPESLYRWQWQSGRLLNAAGQIDAAITAYRQAVDTLQPIRQDLTASYRNRQQSLQDSVGDLYFELADLLLQRAPLLDDSQQKTSYLRTAQNTIEQYKSAELTDYFQDDCVADLQARTTTLQDLGPDTAVIYPILLNDRTELLVSFQNDIRQVTVPVAKDALTDVVRQFRQRLESFDIEGYLPYAQQLYRWLVTPLEPLIDNQQIATVVFVPDGPLRSIPLSALHDGNEFLIAKFAIATTPGLTLTDFRPTQRQNLRVLLNGLTEARQGFEALPAVDAELQTIQQLYPGTVLKDEQYLLEKVRMELAETPYSIVHIASHAQFAGTIEDTFLLTYDDKLTMDRLEQFMGLSQFRTQPVELLTLSACQTAAGDDRSALGLAGVAVKAGARSALASLWSIEDTATSILITEFYRQLKNPELSKAQALRQAQLTLINSPTNPLYVHPSLWGPFLLIGNWL